MSVLTRGLTGDE